MMLVLLVAFVGLAGKIWLDRTHQNAIFAPVPGGTVGPQPTQVANTVNVTADKGHFSPSTFTTELLDKLILNVTAVDRDYTFTIAGYPRLTTPLPKGKTTQVVITQLGIDTYTYSCNPGCTGTLTVTQKTDQEE